MAAHVDRKQCFFFVRDPSLYIGMGMGLGLAGTGSFAMGLGFLSTASNGDYKYQTHHRETTIQMDQG